MSQAGSDKLPPAAGPVRGETDKMVFPDQLGPEKPQPVKPSDEELKSLDSRNAIQTGLKDGYDRDAKGNPVPEWK